MKIVKRILLILVLALSFLLPIFCGPGVYASQLTFNYDVYCPDANTTFYGGSGSWGYRYRYIFFDVFGTLVGTPTSPGHFTQQITIPSSLYVWVYTYVPISEKGPDLTTVPLTSIGMNLPPGALSLDQSEPFRFTSAHWSVGVRQDGVFHSFYDVDAADADLLLHGGDFPYSTGGGYSPGSSIDVPIEWIDTSLDPTLPQWYGDGTGRIDFDLIITQEGDVVPVPGTLVLFGSGLLGWLGWRLKSKET
jgi:hypothetical protein